MFEGFLNLIQSIPGNIIKEPKLLPADSVKVLAKEYATKIITKPDEFFVGVIKDLLSFGEKVLIAFIIYIIGALLIKWIKKYLHKVFIKRKTEATVASFTMSIVSISLTILLIAITVATLGINTTSIAALLAAGGMAIGMAMSGTLQNFAGGIMILGFKPFKSGDHILAQGIEGVVTEVNIVSTKIKTFDNAIVILPNGSLFNSNITNVTDSYFRRVRWNIDVAYGSDLEATRKAILDIINSHDKVLHKNEENPVVLDPACNLKELKDSGIEFYARAWTTVGDYWDVYFYVLEHIYQQLPQQGIEFPFPQMDVHLFNQNK